MTDTLILKNNAGVKWAFISQLSGWSYGSISYRDQLLDSPLNHGILFLRRQDNGETRWLMAENVEQTGECSARLSGRVRVDGVNFKFELLASLAHDLPVLYSVFQFSVDADLLGWEVGFAYQEGFAHPWMCHFYPFAEDSKYVAVSPLTYVGVPAALIYRNDFSHVLLFGIDPSSDYLNPNTWTGTTSFFFYDQVIPPQFRMGGGNLKANVNYSLPLQLLISAAGDPLQSVADLTRTWISINNYQIDSLFVRTSQQAVDLFLDGRHNTNMWQPGIGYRLEEGDPNSNFVYLGEQPLSAYFEYLAYELTNDETWRQRCFEQMDFMLKAQNNNPDHRHYGAIHTAFDLGEKVFNSDDRGNNIGYKPDLIAYMARYMLMTWSRVLMREGLDCQKWYKAAVRAADWVLRQRNPDGGLPQKVDIVTGSKSVSSTSGRALPAFPVIYKITGDIRYKEFSEELERYLVRVTEARLYYSGHHPDLPPDELEEASIWGVVEYWLNKYEHTGDPEALQRAQGNAYLSFLWWCPKQLSWINNPTQMASAEQQHFLQYSLYCYHNRKVQCLWRLFEKTEDPLFKNLYHRTLQGIFWTQITEGEYMGATHERVADPWLKRNDYEEIAKFNSQGTIYMGEQSLDTILQLVEMMREDNEYRETHTNP
jgi:hypothetical protein